MNRLKLEVESVEIKLKKLQCEKIKAEKIQSWIKNCIGPMLKVVGVDSVERVESWKGWLLRRLGVVCWLHTTKNITLALKFSKIEKVKKVERQQIWKFKKLKVESYRLSVEEVKSC